MNSGGVRWNGDRACPWSSLPGSEKRYLLKVLQAVGGNKTVAAKILHFDRKTLYRKLETYGVS